MRFLAVLGLLVGLMGMGSVGHVYAETAEWDAATAVGMPKGVVGADGIRCHGEATQDGFTYWYTNYVGADADEPTDSEHAWQVAFCHHLLETDMSNRFLREGIALDTSRIKVTITRL